MLYVRKTICTMNNNNCAFYASQFFEIKVDLVITIFGLYLFFLSYQSCASTEISTQFTGSSLTEVLSTERYIKTVRIPGYLCSVRFRVLQPERILKEAISRPLCLYLFLFLESCLLLFHWFVYQWYPRILFISPSLCIRIHNILAFVF